MSIYSTGSVNITIGSSAIRGNGTDFLTYAAQGYLFRLRNESVYYEVSTVTNATNLNLSANYSNSGYNVGSPLNARPYSIVTDYTPHYSYPEMSPNDTGISYVFTKAMRSIDNNMYNASVNTVTCASDINITASQRGLILTAPSGTPWKLTVSNTGTVLTASIY